ncbi:MAG TPA: cupin domain-containing protein, partial [Thermomicrobiales bacterium]|nr:cupin domain-containing protein [Thermomicrobiales bacterium]
AGGTRVAELGPLHLPAAARYLLRAGAMTGPPGGDSPVHMHPGAEVYYLLRGELSVRTPAGTTTAAAGAGLLGPAGDTPMQPRNSGTTDLRALVLFAVDADRAFSSPATLPASPGLPNTGAGGGAPAPGWWLAPCGLAATLLATVAARLTRRRA